MNYLKMYCSLIDKRLKEPAIENFDKHHIIPECFNETKSFDFIYNLFNYKYEKNQLVCLSYKEHYFAHELLVKIFKNINKDAYFRMLCAWNFMNTDKVHTNKEYELYRKAYSLINSEMNTGENNGNYGHKWSDKQKQHLSNIRKEKGIAKGINNPRSKSVVLLDIDGNYINKFGTCRECANYINTCYSTITACCKRKILTIKKHITIYEEDWINIYKNNKDKLNELIYYNNYDSRKERISKSHKGLQKGKNNPRATPIVQLSLNGELIREYEYISQVKEYKFNVKTVGSCINHKYITKLGDNIYGIKDQEKYIWMKKSDYIGLNK